MHLQKNVQREGTVYSNLTAHIKSQNSVFNEKPANQSGNSFKTSTVTSSGRTIYGRIDWLCNNLKPFSLVRDTSTRKYTNLELISVSTFQNDIEKTTKKFEVI